MKILLTLINLILLTLILYFGVSAFYTGLKSHLFQIPVFDGNTGNMPPASSMALKDMSPPVNNYQAISKRNLFKVQPKETSEESPDAQPLMDELDHLSKTDLSLKLWGTVSGSGPDTFAVIEDLKTKKQELFRPGDRVQGALIKGIYREKVVLNHNGIDQVLEMDMTPVMGKGAVSAPAVALDDSDSQNLTLERSLIDEASRDLNSLMKQVRIRPHFYNGKPDGLMLYGIKPDSLFQDMGLKNGDIITGVDGKEIKSVDDALSLYENLKNQSDINVQIKRRGIQKEIRYHVQ